MRFESMFNFGDIVILKTDHEKMERMVTQITFNPNSIPRYLLSCGAADSWHYEMEFDIVKEKNNKAGFQISQP